MAAMKQLINAPDAVVTEALDGLVLSHAHLQRLDGWPEVSHPTHKGNVGSKGSRVQAAAAAAAQVVDGTCF